MVATAMIAMENGQAAKVVALAVERGMPIGEVEYLS